MGQLHLRRTGTSHSGAPALLMLHWTPWSSTQYVTYLPLLADAGFAVIAPDHMGYGFSDPRPTRWMVEDYADCLAAVLDDLNIDKAIVAGGHFSSEIAVEFHLRHPDRVTHLVLDGCPVWDQALRDEILKIARQPTPDWNEDGSHIAWVWERSLWLQRMWDKNFEMNDDGAALIRRAVIESMLAQQSDDSADALRNYDMEAKLKQVSVPTLALTAETDPLNNCHDLVLNLVQGCEGHTFNGSHPHHWPERAREYVDIVVQFLNET